MVNERILEMLENIRFQHQIDIKACNSITICFDEFTYITNSARLAKCKRYFVQNNVNAESTLTTTTKRVDIYNAVVDA